MRLIAPKFFTPFRMTGRRSKNDVADAAAICEAVQRPHMLFVPIKSIEQQQVLSVHRVRQGLIEARTATINRMRGILSEFGVVLPLKASTVRLPTASRLEELPVMVRVLALEMLAEVAHLDERITDYDKRIASLIGDADSPARRLMKLCGVAEKSASAIVAMIGNGRDFRCGRLFAAWLGLVPSQYSSGGKTRLGRITKAGDPYLRSLLVMGARAVLAAAHRKTVSAPRNAFLPSRLASKKIAPFLKPGGSDGQGKGVLEKARQGLRIEGCLSGSLCAGARAQAEHAVLVAQQVAR